LALALDQFGLPPNRVVSIVSAVRSIHGDIEKKQRKQKRRGVWLKFATLGMGHGAFNQGELFLPSLHFLNEVERELKLNETPGHPALLWGFINLSTLTRNCKTDSVTRD